MQNKKQYKRMVFMLLGFALVFNSVNGYAQDTIFIKNEYSANKKYIIEEEINNDQVMFFDGPKDFMKKLDSEGFENPKRKKESDKSKYIITTGDINNRSIPIQIQYLNPGKKQENVIIKSGDIVYGKYDQSDNFKIDSSSNSKLLKNGEAELLVQVKSDLNRKKSEALGMRFITGEPLEDTSLITYNLEGKTIETKIVNTLVLKKITDNIAYLELEVKGENKDDKDGFAVNTIIVGKGVMTYDVRNKYLLSNQFDLSMIMEMTIMKEIYIKMNQNTSTSYQCLIK